MNILIIEDDEAICEVLKMIIEYNGWHCDCAKNIDDVKKILTTKKFDVICLDLMMDGRMSVDNLTFFDSNVVLLSAWPRASTYEAGD